MGRKGALGRRAPRQVQRRQRVLHVPRAGINADADPQRGAVGGPVLRNDGEGAFAVTRAQPGAHLARSPWPSAMAMATVAGRRARLLALLLTATTAFGSEFLCQVARPSPTPTRSSPWHSLASVARLGLCYC